MRKVSTWRRTGIFTLGVFVAAGAGVFCLISEVKAQCQTYLHEVCDPNTMVIGCHGVGAFNCTAWLYDCPPQAFYKRGVVFPTWRCASEPGSECTECVTPCRQDEYYWDKDCTVQICVYPFRVRSCTPGV